MFKTISKVQGFIKSRNRLLGSLTPEILVTSHVDKKQKIVYGGDVRAPTYKNSFGSLLFSRLMNLNKEEFLQVCIATKYSLSTKNFIRKGVALARKLQKEGIEKGDIVILMGDNSLNMNIAVAGIFFLGAVPAPISTKIKQGEFHILVKSARPKVFFIERKYLLEVKSVIVEGSQSQTSKVFLLNEKREETDVDIEPFDELICNTEQDVESFKPAEIKDPENELALVVVPLTQGPSGRLVGITHHNLNSLIARFDSTDTGMLSKQVILMVQKIAWMSGVYGFITSCCYGAKLLVVKEFDEEIFMKTIEEYRATISILVSDKLWLLYKHQYIREYNLCSLQYILTMDGFLAPNLILGMKEKFGVSLKISYGISELTGIVLQSLGSTKPGSSGTLSPGAYGKVVSEKTHVRVGPKELGIFCFKGPTLTKGYINDKKSTQQLLDKEGFLVSEMFGYYDEDGFFYVLDRLRNVIKYKDCDISSWELEDLIKALDEVRDVAVTGVQHPNDGYWPLAIVVLRPRSKLTAQAIIKHVEKSVEDCKRLRAGVIFIKKIPRSKETGNIKRYLIAKVLSNYRIPAELPDAKSATFTLRWKLERK